MRLRLTWVTFDGVVTEFSGVGTTTRYLSYEWPRIEGLLSDRFESCELRLVGVSVAAGSPFRRESAAASRERVTQHLVAEGAVGTGSPYGRPIQWRDWTAELTQWIVDTRDHNTIDVVILNDVHFLAAAAELARLRSISVVPVLHSVAQNWRYDGNLSERRSAHSRTHHEATSLQAMATAQIACYAVSESLADAAAATYGVPRPGVLRLGISAQLVRAYVDTLTDEIESVNGLRPFVASSDFAMWFGRATLDKGLDVAMEGLHVVHARTGIPGIVFAADFGSSADQAASKSLLSSPPEGVRVVTEYPFHLPRGLLGANHLRGLLVVPRSEPWGLTPSEFFAAAAHGTGHPSIAYTSVGGLVEQPALRDVGVDLGRSTSPLWNRLLDDLERPPSVKRERLERAAGWVELHDDIASNIAKVVLRRTEGFRT